MGEGVRVYVRQSETKEGGMTVPMSKQPSQKAASISSVKPTTTQPYIDVLMY